MDNQDRQAIEELFVRLSEVERQAPPRDPEAERFIRDRISRQPAAPYLMAQTIVVQEHALQEAQRRIQELEQRRTGIVPSVPRARASAPETMPPAQGGRGGFLAGAAQTAMGVAGGFLLGNFIAGMLGGNEAQAAETSPEPDQDSEIDADADQGDGGFFDGGDVGEI